MLGISVSCRFSDIYDQGEREDEINGGMIKVELEYQDRLGV
jgi:hypothetical protein